MMHETTTFAIIYSVRLK